MEPYSRPPNPPNPSLVNSGNNGSGETNRNKGSPSVAKPTKAKGLCYSFNSQQGCNRKDCRFIHACSFADKKQGKDWVCQDAGHNVINHK